MISIHFNHVIGKWCVFHGDLCEPFENKDAALNYYHSALLNQ